MKKLQILLPMLLMALLSFAQKKIITGTVTGKSDKTPIEGATVQSKNKTILTDSAGKFTIEASVGDNLTFTHIGMKPTSLKITGTSQNFLYVEIEISGGELETVVV